MNVKPIHPLETVTKNTRPAVEAELARTGGLLRLVPNWVPRSFLHPGRRLKLHPDDLYAYGTQRGGIDERWFASVTEAMNDGRLPDEGLSYCVAGGWRFTLRQAIADCGPAIVGPGIWKKYGRWPVLAKFFDNQGPIPFHMHQNTRQARLVGQEGKPEAYYFPPQHNSTGNNFPYTFMGLEPGTTKAQLRRCLENWDQGDNGILDLSKAYRLQPGTGWLIGPGILHAPGSLCTYEPQWGSDVFAMYQNLVEDRFVPWELLVKDMPKNKHRDLDFIVNQLDWAANVDTHYKEHHFMEPVIAAGAPGQGYIDRWIVYGRINGAQLFTAKELTVEPGAKCMIKDQGAYGLTCVQGSGRINGQSLNSPSVIRFGELTEDEYFCTEAGAQAGVTFDNTSGSEPLVALRYFGPNVNPDAPEIGTFPKDGADS